jgi:hypothetical protein
MDKIPYSSKKCKNIFSNRPHEGQNKTRGNQNITKINSDHKEI